MNDCTHKNVFPSRDLLLPKPRSHITENGMIWQEASPNRVCLDCGAIYDEERRTWSAPAPKDERKAGA